jgi:hypothetical protein
LDAGETLRDTHILARHADHCTTEHHDQTRGNLSQVNILGLPRFDRV